MAISIQNRLYVKPFNDYWTPCITRIKCTGERGLEPEILELLRQWKGLKLKQETPSVFKVRDWRELIFFYWCNGNIVMVTGFFYSKHFLNLLWSVDVVPFPSPVTPTACTACQDLFDLSLLTLFSGHGQKPIFSIATTWQSCQTTSRNNKFNNNNNINSTLCRIIRRDNTLLVLRDTHPSTSDNQLIDKLCALRADKRCIIQVIRYIKPLDICSIFIAHLHPLLLLFKSSFTCLHIHSISDDYHITARVIYIERAPTNRNKKHK